MAAVWVNAGVGITLFIFVDKIYSREQHRLVHIVYTEILRLLRLCVFDIVSF
jgi:predicted ferric reductase